MKDNILFILAHPIQTLRVKARQIEVGIEHASPPPGTTIEEFPNLPVQVAAKLMSTKSEVVYFKWPESTHGVLKKGQEIRPGGSHPEHRDI